MFLEPILTLHAEELDEIGNDEKELLIKIMQSSGNTSAIRQGAMIIAEDSRKLEKSNFMQTAKIVIDFSGTFSGSNIIRAPSLIELNKDIELKKNLWQTMLSLLKS